MTSSTDGLHRGQFKHWFTLSPEVDKNSFGIDRKRLLDGCEDITYRGSAGLMTAAVWADDSKLPINVYRRHDQDVGGYYRLNSTQKYA